MQWIDEADAVFGSREEEGDSGVSGRVFAAFARKFESSHDAPTRECRVRRRGRMPLSVTPFEGTSISVRRAPGATRMHRGRVAPSGLPKWYPFRVLPHFR